MGILARLFGWLRRRPQQPVLDERGAYERCHGDRPADVRVVPAPPPTPRVLPRLPGDHLRRCFEERLDGRHRKRLGDGLERRGTETFLDEGGVRPEDHGEDPVELLRREAVAAADRSRDDDSVDVLAVADPLDGRE